MSQFFLTTWNFETRVAVYKPQKLIFIGWLEFHWIDTSKTLRVWLCTLIFLDIDFFNDLKPKIQRV